MKYPYLELEFAEGDTKRFLIEASFCLNENTAVKHSLISDPPANQTFRALCILMLLAKHRGESFVDEKGNMTFKAALSKQTWIKTLGENFGRTAQSDLAQNHFHDLLFLSARRGTGHNSKDKKDDIEAGPSATFHAKQMPLQNLFFFKRRRGLPEDTRMPMTQKDLASFAVSLEKYEVDKYKAQKDKVKKSVGWIEHVDKIVTQTNKDRPLKSLSAKEKINLDGNQEAHAFVLSENWRLLAKEIREGSQWQARAGNWYVVSVTPSWLMDWKSTFCDSVKHHGAKIKFAYHSPSAAESCPAIRAQWRMHIMSFNPKLKEPANYVRDRLISLKGEMKSWIGEAQEKVVKNNKQKGEFQFFESHIAHPFMAIMSVPPASKKTARSSHEAPAGTWCMLGLYPLYPETLDKRCGLFLNRPSPMLDIYYNSILKFFEQGPKDGYLKAVDLLNS